MVEIEVAELNRFDFLCKLGNGGIDTVRYKHYWSGGFFGRTYYGYQSNGSVEIPKYCCDMSFKSLSERRRLSKKCTIGALNLFLAGGGGNFFGSTF